MNGFFREAIRERGKALVASARATFDEPKRLRAAVAAISGASGPILTTSRIEELQKLIRDATAIGTLNTLPRRTVREACAALLAPPEPIAASPHVLSALFGEIARRRQRSAMAALIATYIERFSQSPEFGLFAQGLRRLVADWPWLADEDWPRLAAEIQFFDHETAPQRLAVRALESNETPRDSLKKFGVEGEARQFSGLAEASFIEACRRITGARGSSVPDFQRRLLEWAQAPSGDLAFRGAFSDLARGLLLSWKTEDPDKAHQSLIITALQKLGGGDPRVGSSRWLQVRKEAPDAYAVMMRWLTRASVLGFLNIVDRSLTDYADRRMWGYRRAFWTSYLLGLDGSPEISEAWVAFGDQAAQIAQRAAAASDDDALLSFGLHNDQARAGRSALIMQIGDFTVAEWSHNARCNVWPRGEKGAPPLYKPNYAPGELYSAVEENKYAHKGAEGFLWQKRIAEKLEGRSFYGPRPSWTPADV